MADTTCTECAHEYNCMPLSSRTRCPRCGSERDIGGGLTPDQAAVMDAEQGKHEQEKAEEQKR